MTLIDVANDIVGIIADIVDLVLIKTKTYLPADIVSDIVVDIVFITKMTYRSANIVGINDIGHQIV